MVRSFLHIFVLVATVGFSCPFPVAAQTSAGVAQGDRERLIRLEEGQKALGQRIEGTNQRIDDTNLRIDDLRVDMNNRFGDLQLWLQMMSVALVGVFAGVFAQGFVVWRRLVRLDTLLESHVRESEKEGLLAVQQREIGAVKERLDRLEGSRA